MVRRDGSHHGQRIRERDAGTVADRARSVDARAVPRERRTQRLNALPRLRELYIAETPEDFVQRLPPPERQPLPGERRHRPISADIKARRESRHLGLIVGHPWTNTFRKLMSDPKTMLRMKESFPVRWALATMDPGDYRSMRADRQRFMLRCLQLYLQSNYEPELIATLTRTKLARVTGELERGARVAMGLIGPVGPSFLAVLPDKAQEDFRARGVA
jgi:hypothetical protein